MPLRPLFISLFALPLFAGCGDDASGGGGHGGAVGGSTQGGSAAGGNSQGGSGGSNQGGDGGSGGTGGGALGFTSLGGSSYETQAHLAASSMGDIVVTWIAVFADGHSAVGYAVSHDSGASFTAPAYAAAPDDRLSTNPVVAVDSTGRFTLGWIGFRLDPSNPDEHVYVARLDPGASTFGAPAIASDDGTATNLDYDALTIAVDASDDALLVWSNFTNFSQGFLPQLLFAKTSDGATFTRTAIVSDESFGNLPALCVDSTAPASPLYVVHLGATGTLTARRSVDHGATWELLPATPAATAVFQRPSCVVAGNSLRVAYGSGDAPFSATDDSPADAIMVMSSANGGSTWAAPVSVTEPGVDQYLFPRFARSPDGKLEIAYYQGVVDAPATFMHASSKSGSAWTRAPIAPAGTFTTDLVLASWLGGYVGVSAPGATGFVAYAENTQNKTHIAFAEIALP
ncbi:MAG: hypothetical protein U0271_44545 [Polyangiaceae bacterium]